MLGIVLALTLVLLHPAPARSAEIAGDPQATAPAAGRDGGRDPGGDLARGARAFASDLWHVASSPARLDREGAAWLAAFLAVGGVIYANDETLYDAVLRNRDVEPYRTFGDVGDALEPVGFMGQTNPYYVAALGLGWALQVDWLTNIPAQILESHLISGGIRNAAKVVIGRRRPFETDDPYTFELDGGTSFPSGHASVVFELATILSHHARSTPVTVLAYAAATSVALQRVHDSTHWPSDVYVAAVSGTLIARSVVARNEARAFALAPVSLGDGIGFAGVVRF